MTDTSIFRPSSTKLANLQKSLSIVIISPHRDDAAFSLALSIGAWLRDGHSITIVNVFTRSLHAPYSDADSVHENDRLSYVSAMRKKEDLAFLRQVSGATMIDLNIKDAPLRLHCSSDIVCDMPIDPADGAFSKIAKAVAKQTVAANTALVLPLALGNHVDHRVARDATLPRCANLPCAFYEDLPYAAREGVSVDPQRFREEVGAQYHERLSPLVCHHTSSVAWKRKVVLGYSSQIGEDIGTLITDFAHRYHGNERIWANESFLSLIRSGIERHAEPLPS